MFIAQGTSCSVTIAAIWSSQPRSSSVVRALVAGKQPITPDLQALITICGPVTKNIGAQIAGIRIRDLINEMNLPSCYLLLPRSVQIVADFLLCLGSEVTDFIIVNTEKLKGYKNFTKLKVTIGACIITRTT